MEQNNWNENENQNFGGQTGYTGSGPAPQQYGQPHEPVIIVGEPERDKRQSKNLAISSLVLGILSLVFCWLSYISIILGVIAVVQGIISVAQHRPGQGMAAAGIATGGLGTLLSLILGFLMIVGMAVLYGM